MRHHKKFLNRVFLAVFSIVAALLPMANPASAAYPPLSTADGKPAIAAHLVRLEKGMAEMALQVLAPGKNLEAVRIDNMGGVSSLWRSDGKDGAAPLSVSRDGASLSSGAQAMNLALGDAETLLSLSLKDHGAFAGKATDFRVTVFFTGGGRAMYSLAASDFTPTALPRAGQEAPAPAVPAGQLATPAQGAASSQTAAERVAALEEQNRQLLELTQKKVESGAATQPPADRPEPPIPSTPGVKPQESTPPSVVPKQQYAPGWLARIISVPKGFNITDPLPPLEIVNFVATKSNYQNREYLKLVEGAFSVAYPLWKAEGFLHVEEAGNYLFSISSSKSNTALAVYVEGVIIPGAMRQGNTLMGAMELDPGLYRVEFRAVNIDYYSDMYDYNFTLQIKRPSDNDGMLPASQVLLLPVQSAGKK